METVPKSGYTIAMDPHVIPLGSDFKFGLRKRRCI